MAGLLSFAPIWTKAEATVDVNAPEHPAPPKTPPFSARLERAVELYRTGQSTTAIALLRTLVEQCDDDVNAHYCLAKALYNARLLNEAAREYREVLRRAPDDDCAHYHLALLLRDLGQLTEAAAELRAAIQLRPGSFGIGWLRRQMLTHHFLDNLLRRLVLRSGIERSLPALIL